MLTIAWKSLMICKHSHTRTHTHSVSVCVSRVCGCVSHYLKPFCDYYTTISIRETKSNNNNNINYWLHAVHMPSLSNPPFSYILAHHIQFSVHNFHIFRFASVLQLMRLPPVCSATAAICRKPVKSFAYLSQLFGVFRIFPIVEIFSHSTPIFVNYPIT